MAKEELFVVVELFHGSPSQVVVFKTHEEAMTCLRRFCKQNEVELEEDAEEASDENGYEVWLMPSSWGVNHV